MDRRFGFILDRFRPPDQRFRPSGALERTWKGKKKTNIDMISDSPLLQQYEGYYLFSGCLFERIGIVH